jgi:hypothetical protein
MGGAEHPDGKKKTLLIEQRGWIESTTMGNREQPTVGRWREGIKRNVPAILTVPYVQNVSELLCMSRPCTSVRPRQC